MVDKLFRHLKNALKNLIPGKYLVFISWKRNYFGFLSASVSSLELLIKSFVTTEVTVNVQIPRTRLVVKLRPIKTDLETFDCIFRKLSCDVDCESAKFIVGAGAHIGMSAVFFALKYPDARIIAIEPDDENYKILVSNTKEFRSIKAIKAGLWSHNTTLVIVNPEEPSWGFQMAEHENGMSALTVEDCMHELGTDYLDILKMNIEGSELEVFSNSDSWIDKTRFIIVELHDGFRPGCTKAMEKAISKRNFVLSTITYNTILYNSDWPN